MDDVFILCPRAPQDFLGLQLGHRTTSQWHTPKGDRTARLKRVVKGRKGIGKFAGLMVANVMEIHTTARGKTIKVIISKTDLFLAQSMREGYLLIEFKRPSKTITRDDQNQAAKYRDDLEPKFGQVEILLLGKGRDSTAPIQNDPPRLKVLGYEAQISAARTQLDWLLAELKRSPN